MKLHCKKKSKKIDSQLPTIFPFSATPNLDEKSISGFEVYKNYLDCVFRETNINNIVISGDYGIGKSSVIRSYEKLYCKKGKNKFLYLSLGEYRNAPLNNINIESGGQPEKSKVKDNKQQNILERRLLLQIYARFHQRHLPASSFKMIQEHSWISKLLIPIVTTLLTGILFVFCFFEKISGLLTNIITQNYIAQFKSINLSVKEQTEKLQDFTSQLDYSQNQVHLILYFILILSMLVVIFFLVSYFLPKWQSKTITIKTNTLEASCERGACESYLDQHTTEIVYCLEKIAKKINYTVVIEDLDRIDTSVCLEIFTRMREINNLVNSRILCLKKPKHLRFIYVANDKIIGELKHSKFADYIMPVIPRLNEKTSEQVLLENIKKVNTELNEELNINLTPNTADTTNNKVIPLVAAYLSDYRFQYAVINDYTMMLRLFNTSNRDFTYSENEINQIAESVFALAVYKNLMPDDYSKIRNGESSVIPCYNPDGIASEKYGELIENLTSGQEPILTEHCLVYAGYSIKNIIKLYKEKLNQNIEATLNLVNNCTIEWQSALKDYCEDLCDKIASFTYDEADVSNTILSIKDNPCCSNAGYIIKYMVAHELTHWNWLFCDKIYAITVLEILLDLWYHSDSSADILQKVFKLANFKIESDESIFDLCKNHTEGLCNGRDLNEYEYKILQLGLGSNFSSSSQISVEGFMKPLKRK